MTATWARSRRARTTAAAAAATGLIAVSVGFAAPAGAYPAGTWFYGELGVTAAQKVSTGKGVTVAVVDTGVKAELPDLAGQVLPGKSYTNPGGDARTDNADPSAKYFGHGTAMAATIASTGKSTGLIGIAPGAKILPVQDAYTGSTDGRYEDMAAGITWATDHGADIINISGGGALPCQGFMQKAVDYAVRHDVIVVAATGNTPTEVSTPANCVGSIAVGALAQSQQFAPLQNESFGPELDFVAPGENIRQLTLTNEISNPTSGTSAATAFASGVFALLRSKFPNDSARQIVTRAMYTVHNGLGKDKFGTRIDDKLGYGALLANYALTVNPPSNAKNPIYDKIEAHLKASSGTSSSDAASSAASSASSSGGTTAAGDDSSGGISGAVIAVVAVVAVLLVIGVIIAVTRSRRHGSRVPGGYPPPPTG